MEATKLMKMTYFDPKAEVCLESYADTVVIEKEGNVSYFAAVRFGGYPESVKGMSEAVFGGGSVSLDIDGKCATVYSRVKQYRKEFSHDGIYAEATLMIQDEEQRADRDDRDDRDGGNGEDSGNTSSPCGNTGSPRKCYLFCPQGDRDRLFEELDRRKIMLYKRGKLYWMDAMIDGTRHRVPLGTKNWQEALHLEKEKIAELGSSKSSGKWAMSRRLFSEIFDSYIENRKLYCAPKTYSTDKDRGKSIKKFFGGKQLRQITADHIIQYQRQRTKSGISGRTVNIEVGLLRRVLKSVKQWSRLADDVQMLPERPKEARVLTPEEKATLIDTAQQNPAWQVARCAGILALNTTMRSCELKGLRWNDIDLNEKILSVRRKSTKTDAGARVIPLNKDALATLYELLERAKNLNCDRQDDYVFPACECGRINPSQPMKGWRKIGRAHV